MPPLEPRTSPPWIVYSMTTPETLPTAKGSPCETQTTTRQGSAPPLQPRVNLHSGYSPIRGERFCALECAATVPTDTALTGTILLLGCTPPCSPSASRELAARTRGR